MTEKDTIRHSNMAEAMSGGDFELNLAKFLLAVNRGSRRCYEDAFRLLYQAWGRGRSYKTLQDFCVHALGWKKEDIVNCLCEAQLGVFSASRGNSVTHKPDDSSCVLSSPLSEPTSATCGVQQAPRYPDGDASVVFGGCHLIKSARNSTRRKRSSRRRAKRADVTGKPLSLLEANHVPHITPDSPSEDSDNPYKTERSVHRKTSVMQFSEHHYNSPQNGSHFSPVAVEVAHVPSSEPYVPPPSRHEVALVATPAQPTDQVASPGQEAYCSSPSEEQEADHIMPSERETGHVTISEEKVHWVPSKEVDNHVAPLKQSATDSVPTELLEARSFATRQNVVCIAPSTNEAVLVPSSPEKVIRIAPSKQEAHLVAPSEQKVDDDKPSKLDVVAQSGPKDNRIASLTPETTGVAQSGAKDNPIAPPAPETTDVAQSGAKDNPIAPPAPETSDAQSGPKDNPVAPPAPETTDVAQSGAKDNPIAPPAPETTGVAQSGAKDNPIAPPAPETSDAQSGPKDNLIASSAPETTGVAQSGPKDNPIAPPAPETTGVAQSGAKENCIASPVPETIGIAQSGPKDNPIASPAPETTGVAQSGPKENPIASPATETTGVAQSGAKDNRIAPPAPETSDAQSGRKDNPIASSAPETTGVAQSGPKDNPIAPPAPETTGVAQSGAKENYIVSPIPETAGVAQSGPKDNPIASPAPETTGVAQSGPKDNPIAPPAPETTSDAQSHQEYDCVKPLTERVECVLPPVRVEDTVAVSQKVDRVAQSTKDVDGFTVSERVDSGGASPAEEVDSVVPSTEDVDTVVPSTEDVDTVVPSTEDVGTVVPSTEDVDTVVPSTEDVDNVPSTEDVDTVVPSTEDVDTVVPSTEDMKLSSVIQEASQALQSLHGCPLGNFHILADPSQDSLLSSELDPRQLPEKVLVLMLTKVFSQFPSKVRRLVGRLQRLAFVVCFRDLEFDDEYLALRLRDLSDILGELMAVVFGCCKEMTEKHITETVDKLRISKQKLRRAQKDYEDNLDKVFKTREELQDAERDLQEAKLKNTKVFKVYSRSQSREPEETDAVASTDISSGARHNSLGTTGNTAVPHVTDHADSGNFSLADELDGCGLIQEGQVGVQDVGDSLLLSVMREFAAIETKHCKESEVDSMLEKLLRNTYDSVILTKKEMRNRLDSNVSAERDAIAKQDILDERQAVTKIFSRELKSLRRNYKALQEDESAVIYRIYNDTEAVRLMELDEEAQAEGRRGVQMLREDKFGRLLMESRQEVSVHASNSKVVDIGEWLMRKRYVMKGVNYLYSRVKVNNTENTVDVTDILGIGEKDPSVIVLSGPKGSGKSCVCHYLLHLWKSKVCFVNSKLHEFDLVVYCTMSNIVASGSWNQYLREHVFFVTLNDFPDLDIHDVLRTATILFLVDAGTPTPAGGKVLSDIFTSLGGNRVVITARSGDESKFVEMAKGHNLSCFRTELCPMTPESIKAYSAQLISLFEKQDSAAEVKVNNFTELICCMKTTQTLLYPLPIAYLLYLWRIDPGHALLSTTVSRLFSQVVITCQLTMTEAIRAECADDRATVRVRVERYTEELYKTAWSQVTQQTWPLDDPILLESGHHLLQDPMFFSNFSPIVMMREDTDGKWRGTLPHPSVADILCGFFLTSRRLSCTKGSAFLRRREKLEKYCVPEIERFRCVLPHAAGALVYNKHSLDDAREIASLYFKSLSDGKDMVSWLELLKECDFISNMCSAVSGVLSRFTSWTAVQHSQQANCAVADLIRKGAYQPQLVILSETLKERLCACGVDCIARALSTCTSTLVHLRQESQFYSWGEDATCDTLVVPLQPPGTLQEFWGHLGVQGAMALRHSHHLEELNVRISSCEALSALVHSMNHIRRNLRYLYLRLDILPSTPVASLDPLHFRGKNLWLRMRGVSDSSVSWVKNVTNRLNSWYTEILLEESSLSPSALQSLKEGLPNTPVHISG